MKKIILIITGVLIFFWSLFILFVPFIGRKSTLTIINVKKDMSKNNSSMYCDYKVYFSFHTNTGKIINCSMFKNVKSDETQIPTVCDEYSIYYMSFLPYIYQADYFQIPKWYYIISATIGLFMIYVAYS